MKFGRYEIDINEDDLILDNGSCYQIITRNVKSGWDSYIPKISKKMFKELQKLEWVFTSEGLKIKAMNEYKSDSVSYWKFNMELINKYVK